MTFWDAEELLRAMYGAEMVVRLEYTAADAEAVDLNNLETDP
jgi:hypothetical protein